MALLDRNGVELKLGQPVKMTFPGTADDCVGTVVGVFIDHVDIEVVYAGAKQSISIRGIDAAFVEHERVTRFEIELDGAKVALESAKALVKASEQVVKDLTGQLDVAKSTLAQNKDAVKDLTKQVSSTEEGLDSARKAAAKEDEENAKLVGDPTHKDAVGLQAMAPPLIAAPPPEHTGEPAGA